MKIPALQLALDCSSTEEAIRDCQTGVVDEIDILECGYSLIAAEGARVVKLFREMYPEKPLLADLNRRQSRNMPRKTVVPRKPQQSFWHWPNKIEAGFRFIRPFRRRTAKKPARKWP